MSDLEASTGLENRIVVVARSKCPCLLFSPTPSRHYHRHHFQHNFLQRGGEPANVFLSQTASARNLSKLENQSGGCPSLLRHSLVIHCSTIQAMVSPMGLDHFGESFEIEIRHTLKGCGLGTRQHRSPPGKCEGRKSSLLALLVQPDVRKTSYSNGHCSKHSFSSEPLAGTLFASSSWRSGGADRKKSDTILL